MIGLDTMLWQDRLACGDANCSVLGGTGTGRI
jgi:hypothetical protein